MADVLPHRRHRGMVYFDYCAGRRRIRAHRCLAWSFAYPVHCVLLWFALGARSLYAHILPIQRALQARQLDAARRLTAHIVSRETSRTGETEIARAAVESTLENGNDAIFGALF